MSIPHYFLFIVLIPFLTVLFGFSYVRLKSLSDLIGDYQKGKLKRLDKIVFMGLFFSKGQEKFIKTIELLGDSLCTKALNIMGWLILLCGMASLIVGIVFLLINIA